MFSRHTELFGLRWAISLRSWSDSIWKHPVFGWVLISLFGSLYVYWAWHIPSPGKAVAALAVIAAIMTFRGEIGGLEKFFWVLVLFAFLFMELRAIDNDRFEYARDQKLLREKETENFKSIGAGLQTSIDEGRTAIDGLKTTLNATQATLHNTEPRAILLSNKCSPYTDRNVSVGSTMGFNVDFTNVGNEAAHRVIYDGKLYVGKKDNEETERRLAQDFDRWWPTAKHQGGVNNATITGDAAFFSFTTSPFTESDIKQLHDRTGTFYVFLRFVYSDHNGRWITDKCFSYQDPLHDFDVSHPCSVHVNLRYRAAGRR